MNTGHKVKIHEGVTRRIIFDCDDDLDPNKDYIALVRVVQIDGEKFFYPVGEFDSDGHLVVTVFDHTVDSSCPVPEGQSVNAVRFADLINSAYSALRRLIPILAVTFAGSII